MKIKYEFANGEVTEVEVSEEIGTVILESRRAEHANNERHRYHAAFSIDDLEYESMELTSADYDPEYQFLCNEGVAQREAALRQLTPTQQRRFEMYENGMSIAEIARAENASFNSVKECIAAAQKKLQKFF